MSQANLKQAPSGTPPKPRPRARVKTFEVNVELTPKLSVGTAFPESIYEARFHGKIQAVRPADEAGDCELELPLPPQTISLADLSITAGGKPSDMVAMRDGKLVWRGPLAAGPTAMEVTYTAIGKGVYELSVPPGGILDHFHVTLAANGSDLRLMELSLQPAEPVGGRFEGSSFREHTDNASEAERTAQVRASLDNTFSFWATEPSLMQRFAELGFKTIVKLYQPSFAQTWKERVFRGIWVLRREGL